MSSPYLESQGCHLIAFYYLLFCSSAESYYSFCLNIFSCPLTHSPDFFLGLASVRGKKTFFSNLFVDAAGVVCHQLGLLGTECSPYRRLWKLCWDSQLILLLLLPLLLSHQYHQQGGDWWLFCLQCWQYLDDLLRVPTGSPSRGGDVAVYVFDINQPSLPTPFYSVLVSISVLWSFQLYFIP